jgi:hypothetical protein
MHITSASFDATNASSHSGCEDKADEAAEAKAKDLNKRDMTYG